MAMIQGDEQTGLELQQILVEDNQALCHVTIMEQLSCTV
jgi:hypothetical protein